MQFYPLQQLIHRLAGEQALPDWVTITAEFVGSRF